MASSNVLFVALLGLFLSTLARPPTEAPKTTTDEPRKHTSGGSGDAGSGTYPPQLTEADMTRICEVNPATGAAPGICAKASAADDFCSKLAASVNGTSVSCWATNVCTFKVGNAAAYISCNTIPPGFQRINNCPYKETIIFVS